MFADDTKIYMWLTSLSDALSFQNDLDKLCGWTREWSLHFNIAKHKYLKYGTTALRSTSIRRIRPVFCNAGYQRTTANLLFQLKFIHCVIVIPFILLSFIASLSL